MTSCLTTLISVSYLIQLIVYQVAISHCVALTYNKCLVNFVAFFEDT